MYRLFECDVYPGSRIFQWCWNLPCERRLDAMLWGAPSVVSACNFDSLFGSPVIGGHCNMKLDQLDHQVHYCLPVFPAGTQRRKSIYEGKSLCLTFMKLPMSSVQTLMPHCVNISISRCTLSSSARALLDNKSKMRPPYVHFCPESAEHPANTSLTVTVIAPTKWVTSRAMKLQGLTPQVDSLLLIRGRCCRTGTVSSVFPILHLGFLFC